MSRLYLRRISRHRPLLVALLLFGAAAGATAQLRPFPQHVRYAAGSLEPDHRTQAELDADVVETWARWKGRYLVEMGTEPDGHPRYRVLHGTGAGVDTVSEGQGYGMLLATLLAGAEPAARTIFDGLWEFALDHPSSIDGRLMDWHVPANEAQDPDGNDAAFDGDADMAMALLLAEEQWGNGGRFDYGFEARRVLAGIEASMLGPESRLPLLGDWVDPAGAEYNQWTVRTSDFMPGHFRVFARATRRAAWSQAVAAVQDTVAVLQTEVSPATGLLPDFTVPVSAADHRPRPAPPGFLEGPNDGAYFYNAGRDPWRLGSDALLSRDVVSAAQARKLAVWARLESGGNPQAIAAGYELDGTPLPGSDFFTSFFVAPFGVAAMLDPAGQSFLNAVWDAVHTRVEDYYEDSVTLLCLLVMSGNFWQPGALFADDFESGDTSNWSGTARGFEALGAPMSHGGNRR